MQVVDVHGVDGGRVADFIGRAVADASLDAAAREPDGEAVRIMVAAGFGPVWATGSRPNSPPQITSVSSSSPRWSRSASRPATGRSVSPANCSWFPLMSAWPSHESWLSMPPE